jgi:tRNA(fMet)-specific endonuclease VapC
VIHIFDTDIFTLSELPDSSEYLRLHARIAQLSPDDHIATTIITYEEQTRGWLAYAAKSRDMQHQIKAYNRLKKHLLAYRDFRVLDFDAHAAAEYERLRSRGIRIGTLDLKIAATALANEAILLSRNLQHFTKIPNLRVEDWTK